MSNAIKNICCIGAGYVGGPTMAVIASHCPNIRINVVDINKKRISDWNNEDLKKIPIYEPGLKELIKKCRDKNLFFSTSIKESIETADMIFISVNTPTKKKGFGAGKASDLKWIESSAREIAKFAKGQTIVVEKSTLPVRTAETIKNILHASEDIHGSKDKKYFSVLSNPEFLAEGTAINDLENPDRVLIGGDDCIAISALKEIYLNWVNPKKILTTNIWSSELSKLTANAFLAQRISSINSISAICEATGADINEVSKAIGMDKRIGSKFLKPGPGFGGSCFKKDILNLVYLSNFYGLSAVSEYWEQILKINDWQQERLSKIIVQKLFGTINGKKLSILGFSFKANTNDTRESPAINICKSLLEEGALLSIFDPVVKQDEIKEHLGDSKSIEKNNNFTQGMWEYASNIFEAVNNSDGLIVLTEWEEFKNIDLNTIFLKMRKPAWIFDSRNIIDKKLALEIGFNVWNLGVNINE